MSHTITRATTSDTKLISELGAATFEQTFRGTCTDKDLEEVLTEFYNEEQVAKELNDPTDYFFVLFHKEVAAGYARIHLGGVVEEVFSDKNSVELKRIYFLEQFHGKGLAKELLAYCIDFLKKKKFDQIYLSVWEHNLRAQAFYEKHGFENSKIENPFPLGETPQMDYWFVRQL
jgi:ribosomal protein S18 acetylase RimI-like enzyme